MSNLSERTWGWRLGLGLLGLLILANACSGSAPAGDVTLQDVINTVLISPAGAAEKPVKTGDALPVGARVRSADSSLVRLSFNLGASVRVSSKTTFTLETPTAPEEARLQLEGGQLRLSLFGHLFGVVTPMGVVQLGGFGEVLYGAQAGSGAGDATLIFRCFSGPCSFQGGGTSLVLGNLEAVTVSAGGQTVIRTTLTELDLRQFIADNPGSFRIIASLTAAPTHTPTSTPDTPTAGPTPTDLPGVTRRPPTATATPTRTRTATRTPAPTDTATLTPSPTDTAPPPTNPPQNNNNHNPPPTNPPAATQAPTNPQPPTNPPPPTDTPLPPPPPTKGP